MLSTIKTVYRYFDATRRFILNVLFGLIIIILAFACLSAFRTVPVEKGTLLKISLSGTVSETISDSNKSVLRSLVNTNYAQETRLKDILDAFSIAERDNAITGVVLDVGELKNVGMASMREIAKAIDTYRAQTGNKVWVWGSSYTQAQYLIAAHADHVSIHSMGMAELKGLSSTSFYMGNFFKSLGIRPEVRKAGAYKSAPEVLISAKPSRESLIAQKSYMDDAWGGICSDLESRRVLKEGTVSQYIAKFDSFLDDEQSLAESFKDLGFLDAVESKEEFLVKLAEAYVPTKKTKDLKLIDYRDYLTLNVPLALSEPGVAVIALEGEISSSGEDGITPFGVGSLLDMVGEDPNVKALIIRLNSPGGDAMASELIREKLLQFKSEKKIPIVISMGDVSASGGYWISTAGDKIVADPYSITGSIGVFAVMFRAEELREMLSIGRGGYKTSPLADIRKPMAAPSEIENRLIDHEVNRIYKKFKELVSQSRQMSSDQVERVAQGRVWTGKQAFSNGLIDVLGGYDEAVSEAQKLGGLSESSPTVVYEPYPDEWKALIKAVRVSVFEDVPEEFLRLQKFAEVANEISGRPLMRLTSEPTL